jgi:hypothetical protein
MVDGLTALIAIVVRAVPLLPALLPVSMTSGRKHEAVVQAITVPPL